MKMSPRVSRLVEKLRKGVDHEELWPHMVTLARWEKPAGSSGERKAFEFIAKIMKGYGWKVQPINPHVYLSLPVSARLRVLGRSPFDVDCITHSYATSTSAGGLEAKVTYLTPKQRAEKTSKRDLEGQIGMVDGLATNQLVQMLESRGAVAAIFINDDELHNMALSAVWGTPVPETAPRLPRIPVVSIRWNDGQRIQKLGAGARVKIRTEVWSGFKNLPMLTCRLAPTNRLADPDTYVMFSGHVDTWHIGAGDNGSANVAMMEVARLLALHRKEMRRGAEMNFWSGHSQGRYAVSTWFADHHWERINRGCVAHVNFDTTGGGGMTVYDEHPVVKELEDLAGSAIATVIGRKAKPSRLSRTGDHSFMGIGLPAAFSVLNRVPAGVETKITLGARAGGGNPWWWHSVHDTLDKMDPEILENNIRIYATMAGALCAEAVPPLNYTKAAKEILDVLKSYQKTAGRQFDLGPALAEGRRLVGLAGRLERRRVSLLMKDGKGAARTASAEMNRCLMRLSRILIPLGYSEVDPFDQDVAQPIPAVPRLRGINRLNDLDPKSNDFGFLVTRLTRSQNKVVHELRRACEAIEETLSAR